MTATDDLVQRNRAYAERFASGDLTAEPAKRVAIVTCMDARLDPYSLLGLELGEAHVIRNAGGVVTEDVIRSLTISQRLLGTREIVLIHHTDCGMTSFRDDELKRQIEDDTGIRPPFAMEAFADLAEDVRQSKRRLQASPFLADTGQIRGYLYFVTSGRLEEVE